MTLNCITKCILVNAHHGSVTRLNEVSEFPKTSLDGPKEGETYAE